LPSTALPATASELLPVPVTVPWLVTVLPVSVVFSAKVSAPP
jgi:hypothetical protein